MTTYCCNFGAGRASERVLKFDHFDEVKTKQEAQLPQRISASDAKNNFQQNCHFTHTFANTSFYNTQQF